MPKVEAKRRPNYNKFDELETEVLEAILRANSDASEAERMDNDTVMYISNLLVERARKEDQTSLLDVEAAIADFHESYYPIEDGKSLYDFDDDLDNETEAADQKGKFGTLLPSLQNGWRKFASAVAVVVLMMFAGTITAYALGYDPIAVIGKWNEEHFWLEKVSVTSELSDKMAEYDAAGNLVPQWLPEGYVLDDIEVAELSNSVSIGAGFWQETTDSRKLLHINYLIHSNDNVGGFYEKDTNDVTEYLRNGITHYIMNNLDRKTIVWQNGKFECAISGDISLEEAQKIIDSIYKE